MCSISPNCPTHLRLPPTAVQLRWNSVYHLRTGAREQLPGQLLPGGGVHWLRGHPGPAPGQVLARVAASVLPVRSHALVPGGALLPCPGLLRGLRSRAVPRHRGLHGGSGKFCSRRREFQVRPKPVSLWAVSGGEIGALCGLYGSSTLATIANIFVFWTSSNAVRYQTCLATQYSILSQLFLW